MANEIQQLCESAVVAYIAGQAPATIAASSVFAGTSRGVNATITDAELEANPNPNVEVSCESADAFVPGSGNWICNLIVAVKSNADDALGATHKARVAEIFGYFHVGVTLPFDISAALAGFTAFLVLPDTQTHGQEDRSWVSRLPLKIHCCGSDIS